MANRKVQGISRRVKVKKELWYLRIKGDEYLKIDTKTKGERNILSALRKILILFYDKKEIDLTNRKKYIKGINVSQAKLYKMKAQDNFTALNIIKEQKGGTKA